MARSASGDASGEGSSSVGRIPTQMQQQLDDMATPQQQAELVQELRNFQINLRSRDEFDIHTFSTGRLPQNPTIEQRNAYTLERMCSYRNSTFIGNDLLAVYHEDFEGWRLEDFRSIHADLRREWRRSFRRMGLYTGPISLYIYEQMFNLASAEHPLQWNVPDLLDEVALPGSPIAILQRRFKKDGSRSSGSRRSSVAPSRQELVQPTPPQQQQHGQQVQQQQIQPMQQTPVRPAQQTPAQPTAARYQTPAAPQRSQPIPGIDTFRKIIRGRTQPPVPAQSPGDSEIAEIPESQAIFAYEQVPPQEFPNEPADPQLMSAFIKLWKTSDDYSGQAYDILDDKIKLFLRTCSAANIPPGQFHAVIQHVLSGRARHYFIHRISPAATFSQIYWALANHFEMETNRSVYNHDWTSITYASVRSSPEYADKSPGEILTVVLDKLELCHRALQNDEQSLIDQVKRACQEEPQFANALYEHPASFDQLSNRLHNALKVAIAQGVVGNKSTYYMDRRYQTSRFQSRDGSNSSRFQPRYNTSSSSRFRPRDDRSRWQKKCYICGKPGCWSTKHSKNDQRQSRERFRRERGFNSSEKGKFSAYLLEYEGHELDEEEHENDPTSDKDSEEEEPQSPQQSFFMTSKLSNAAYIHRFNPIEPEESEPASAPHDVFLLGPYDVDQFQGILPDTGAAGQSTAGKSQVLALQRILPTISVQTQHAGMASIRFGNGPSISSIGSVSVPTVFGDIQFHVLETPTPFLLCIRDMDMLGIYLNNVTNELIQESTGKRAPVIRKMGHPWFPVAGIDQSMAYLTESELRRLHRRFGHPSVEKLRKLLTRSGHDVESETLELISKFCHHCQMKSDAPRRFKFTLKDDVDFNYELVVDVMCLESRPVLHVVDTATSFQAGKFLKSLSAKDTWEALKMCWIDTYLGPPDVLSFDAGTNFAAAEFRAEAKLMGISCHQIPIEAHWSIGKVERYHAPLRRAFEIIRAERKDPIAAEIALQMALKAVNDTVGLNGLVPTLLVFGAFPRISYDSPPTPTSVKRAELMNKAMSELRKIWATKKVNDALNTRNGPSTTSTLPLSLPIGSEVRIWREKQGWQGPFRVLSVGDNDVTIDNPNGPQIFRNTHVQPYERWEKEQAPQPMVVVEIPPSSRTQLGEQLQLMDHSDQPVQGQPVQEEKEEDEAPFEYPDPPVQRRRGRPRKASNTHGNFATAKPIVGHVSCLYHAFFQTFLTKKEQLDFELAIELRRQGKITIEGRPFEASDQLEITTLIGSGTLKPVHADVAQSVRIFGSRIVREIKQKHTPNPYEKSRLVVQGFGDEEKKMILTQAPTIQRCSQRLILALTPTLRSKNHACVLALRDITQAYTQSATEMQRDIYISIPTEIRDRYPPDTIFQVVRPLYGIAEADAHWFQTYHRHHVEKLNMTDSAHDPCLLVTTGEKPHGEKPFGIAGIQTDDTLLLGSQPFMKMEQQEMDAAGFNTKPRKVLNSGDEADFNGSLVRLHESTVKLVQKGQLKRLARVDHAKDAPQQYVEQRARGAYVASICQPEAQFEYSVAAQSQSQSQSLDVKRLNKTIEWQLQNQQRGLTYVSLDLSKAKLFVFTDGSFANNADLSSQIGYVIVLANEENQADDHSFKIRGNIVHWSSTKCKRVTRSVLASEIYGLVGGFDLAFVISRTLQIITTQLNIPDIPLVVCTDSFSLYECLVKLGTTAEKRLMIDIMSLRQSYEAREISEIRWINGQNNPADAMTKSSPNPALTTLISTNELSIRLEGWVERS